MDFFYDIPERKVMGRIKYSSSFPRVFVHDKGLTNQTTKESIAL
jgi:hypothetical protein